MVEPPAGCWARTCANPNPLYIFLLQGPGGIERQLLHSAVDDIVQGSQIPVGCWPIRPAYRVGVFPLYAVPNRLLQPARISKNQIKPCARTLSADRGAGDVIEPHKPAAKRTVIVSRDMGQGKFQDFIARIHHVEGFAVTMVPIAEEHCGVGGAIDNNCNLIRRHSEHWLSETAQS